MTSPTGGEHLSRYRALGEFDNLIREAQKAKRALRELREEEAKLNSQSIAEDRQVAASRQQRAKTETDAAQKTVAELSKTRQAAGGHGQNAGKEFTRQFGIGSETEARVISRTSLDRMSKILQNMFSDSGKKSGVAFADALGRQLSTLNSTLRNLKLDPLDLDVDVEDAKQSIRALEFELNNLGNSTSNSQVRIDTNRALSNLRSIQKLFRDEVAEDVIKESRRIQAELKKLDDLPSGRSFKFWALTALSDMSKVFEEADKGTRIFQRLRLAIAAGSGGRGTNVFGSLISGFDTVSQVSSRLLQRLGRVSGELYRMPGIIALIVSSLPALIAGFGALLGGATGLASALGSLSGFLFAGPGLFAAFGTGVAALGSTFSGLGDVLKDAKKAQQEEAEAREKARLGTDKALTAQQKYAAVMRALAPATQEVIKGFLDFSNQFGKVQQKVQERFFQQVVKDIDSLNATLPIAEDLLGKSAEAIGKLASEGIRMITSGPWKRDFGIIAQNNATYITSMGRAGLSLANVFRNIAVAAGPFTTWVTAAIENGAASFADWSAQARSDGSINDFLEETKETGQVVWQIFKNLGATVSSFFTASVDQGQDYLRMLRGVTESWRNVAETQEAANSPLRKWLQDIKPLLSAMGALIRDLGSGLAALASDQRNIGTMIDLLNVLRQEVLPPIFDILQQLNDSGIAVTVFRAFGNFLEALSDFLSSGATTAITVFVTVLSNFAELIFAFAGLPVISHILGGLASALAALAAVSIVARFTGLFKLWDFFMWMRQNRGNLSGAFADAARGVASLPVSGQSVPDRAVPSTVERGAGGGPGILNSQARATENVGQASSRAASQASIFSRALSGITTAGGVARGALSSLTGFLGGPWGVALVAATTLIGVITSKLFANKREAEDTKNAFQALKGAYEDLSTGDTSGVEQLAATDEKFKEVIDSASRYGITLRDVSGALNGQEQSLTRFNGQIDAQINSLKAQREAIIADLRARGVQTGEIGDGTEALNQQIEAAERYKNSVNGVADTNRNVANATGAAANIGRTYQERLAGLTQAQVDNAVAGNTMMSQLQTLSNALDTMSSATATTQDRAKALSDIINYETGAMESANEAAESFSGQLLNLRDSINSNGRSLSLKTREGLRNRDALQAAARATRELYLQDIASGTPMEEAIRRHQKRIKELKDEAKFGRENKRTVDELIDTYGDVPENVKTNIKTDTKGFQQVFADLQKLQIMQKALQEGKSASEAERAWKRESSFLYQRPPSTGDGYGVGNKYANGGPVWGAGTRNSDSIRAWLSNGEFVQPTDAVEHYGMPIMEALRTKKLNKAALNEALPDDNSVNFRNGGAAHSMSCPSCASGGHKFAKGGGVRPTWPFLVNPENTKINKNWAYQGLGGLGQGTGSGGVAWMMGVLRKQFPGLGLLSGYRPGARTLSGNLSYHGLNRAVDLAPRRDVAQWIRSNYGARTKELITPFQDLNLHNGKPHRYTGAIWNQHNFAGGNAHNHWSYNKGGLVDIMKMLNMDNLAPTQSAPLPTTPRTLSPAASSVVNNTSESGTNFGDVIINNPQQERAGDSVRNAIYRTMYLI